MNRTGIFPQDEPLVGAVADIAVHHFPEWEPEASGFAAGAAVIASVAFLTGTVVGLLLH